MGNISTPMNPPFAQFDASDVEHLPSTPTPGPAVDRLVANPTGCPAARCSNTGAIQPCLMGPANSLETQSSSTVAAGQNSERQPTITTQSGSTVTSETRVAPQPGLQHRQALRLVPQPPVVYPQVRNGDLWDGPWVPQPAKYGGLFDI
ncbi:hypothetical protein B0H16DRAFT_1484871 [Mycena metata]|uniref:Uncharacterized protein n=1 Tax=Mycena metata TaxID=1033252 RepID=A0AAD7DQ53_9AGAR|nr:hypothetical protein B0H16DRAFT_1484871 [Mycena metata]